MPAPDATPPAGAPLAREPQCEPLPTGPSLATRLVNAAMCVALAENAIIARLYCWWHGIGR